MLRLDYFLMRGGVLSTGDKIRSALGVATVTDKNIEMINGDTDFHWVSAIYSFAPRSSDVSQPSRGSLPVVTEWSDGLTEVTDAKWVSWGNDRLESWRPNLERLIEQQPDYGEQKKPIEELMLNAKESTMKKQGDEVVIIYNDLIGSGRKEAVGTYQMETDKEILILDENGIFEIVDKEWFVEYALTDEQEMTLAKSAQIDKMLNIYSEQFNDGGELSDMLEIMQANGDLQDIILPLRG